MKFLGNAYNILAYAVCTALNPVGTAKFDRQVVTRTGGGLVRMTGAHTGQTAKVVDVEIRNATITGDPRVSAPRFLGVGNGAMSGVEADAGAVAQQVTVTLKDLGTTTEFAYLPFQGKTLRAKRSGPDANYIQITVDESPIVRTATDKALLSELQAGSNTYTGDQWDLGGLPRNPDQTIPAGCPRISFGADPAVYHQFKVFQNGQYTYSFTPVPLRSAPIGSRVYAVTEGRTVTVTHTLGAAAAAFVPSGVYTLGQLVRPTTPNGHWYEVTDGGTAGTEPTWSTTGGTVSSGGVDFIDRGQHTRTYTNIETLYDALAAIDGDAASLIEVVDPVILDYNEGGMAIIDLAVRTSAYLQMLTKDGSDHIKASELAVSIAAGAPMEDVTIRCVGSGTINAELWDVRGTVTGLMAQAVTGVPYVSGTLSFTIPLLPLPEVAPTTDISYEFNTTFGGSPKPRACVEALLLGSDAQQGVIEYEWQLRETACDCGGSNVVGPPNPIWLGINPEVNLSVDTLHAEIATRVATACTWYSGFTTANTLLASSATAYPVEITPGDPNTTQLDQTYSAVMTVDVVDIQAAQYLRNLLCNTLIALKEEAGEATIATAATDLWDDLMALIETDFTDLEDNAGGGFWHDVNLKISVEGSGGSVADSLALYRRIFSTEFRKYTTRYDALIDDIYVAAGLVPPSFESPTGGGSGPWVDHNGPGWFVAKGHRRLPIQPGHGYHAAIEVIAPDGTVFYEATREFYVAMDIQCEDGLQVGDIFKIIIGPTGTTTGGYGSGDNYQLKIVDGSPEQFGGGQTGDDTRVWGVLSSVEGARADYLQYTPAPAAYEIANPGEDFDFTIAMGSVPHRLGDRFDFFIEGGEYRVRINGGTWSADLPIEPTATITGGDGISLAFDEGIAPSFVAGDFYTFTVGAVNGGGNLHSLTQGGIVTTEFTESAIVKHRIEADLDAADLPAEAVAECLVLFQEPTEVGATVTLRGFTLATDVEGDEVVIASALTNGSQQLLIQNSAETLATTCDKWTLTYYSTANTETTIGWRWGFIGIGLEMRHVNNKRADGNLSQQWSLPKRARRRSRLGVEVDFVGLLPQRVEDLRWLLEHATINDHGRVVALVREAALAPSRARDAFGAACTPFPEAGIVTIESGILPLEDVFKFADPTNIAMVSLKLELTPVP
jgi:hypothetical protein